jgi:uncharacterized protein YndB with AHSA1/START domain
MAMARNETVIEAPPEEVWKVLATPDSYAEWVVGSSDIRDADECWPEPGCRFYHRVGTGPLKLSDHTEVLESKPGRRLRLRAKARPLGVAHVTLELHPHARGTRVVMVEDAGNMLTRLVFNPLTHLLVRGRNTESLRRLKHIVEATTRHRQGVGQAA